MPTRYRRSSTRSRGVTGNRGDQFAGLVNEHLLLGDLGDGVDGYQGLRMTEAKESAVRNEEETDLPLAVVDEKVDCLADTLAVLVVSPPGRGHRWLKRPPSDRGRLRCRAWH